MMDMMDVVDPLLEWPPKRYENAFVNNPSRQNDDAGCSPLHVVFGDLKTSQRTDKYKPRKSSPEGRLLSLPGSQDSLLLQMLDFDMLDAIFDCLLKQAETLPPGEDAVERAKAVIDLASTCRQLRWQLRRNDRRARAIALVDCGASTLVGDGPRGVLASRRLMENAQMTMMLEFHRKGALHCAEHASTACQCAKIRTSHLYTQSNRWDVSNIVRELDICNPRLGTLLSVSESGACVFGTMAPELHNGDAAFPPLPEFKKVQVRRPDETVCRLPLQHRTGQVAISPDANWVVALPPELVTTTSVDELDELRRPTWRSVQTWIHRNHVSKRKLDGEERSKTQYQPHMTWSNGFRDLLDEAQRVFRAARHLQNESAASDTQPAEPCVEMPSVHACAVTNEGDLTIVLDNHDLNVPRLPGETILKETFPCTHFHMTVARVSFANGEDAPTLQSVRHFEETAPFLYAADHTSTMPISFSHDRKSFAMVCYSHQNFPVHQTGRFYTNKVDLMYRSGLHNPEHVVHTDLRELHTKDDLEILQIAFYECDEQKDSVGLLVLIHDSYENYCEEDHGDLQSFYNHRHNPFRLVKLRLLPDSVEREWSAWLQPPFHPINYKIGVFSELDTLEHAVLRFNQPNSAILEVSPTRAFAIIQIGFEKNSHTCTWQVAFDQSASKIYDGIPSGPIEARRKALIKRSLKDEKGFLGVDYWIPSLQSVSTRSRDNQLVPYVSESKNQTWKTMRIPEWLMSRFRGREYNSFVTHVELPLDESEMPQNETTHIHLNRLTPKLVACDKTTPGFPRAKLVDISIASKRSPQEEAVNGLGVTNSERSILSFKPSCTMFSRLRWTRQGFFVIPNAYVGSTHEHPSETLIMEMRPKRRWEEFLSHATSRS